MNTSWNAGFSECRWGMREEVSSVFLADDNLEKCVLRCILYPCSLKKWMWESSAWDTRTKSTDSLWRRQSAELNILQHYPDPLPWAPVQNTTKFLRELYKILQNFSKLLSVSLSKYVRRKNNWKQKKENLRLQNKSRKVLGKWKLRVSQNHRITEW